MQLGFNLCFTRSCLGRNDWGSWGCHGRCYSSVATTVVQRNPLFSSINSDDISYFKKLLGDRGVVQDELALEAANTDWMHKYRGSSKLMLQPRNSEEVEDFFILIPQLLTHVHKIDRCLRLG